MSINTLIKSLYPAWKCDVQEDTTWQDIVNLDEAGKASLANLFGDDTILIDKNPKTLVYDNVEYHAIASENQGVYVWLIRKDQVCSPAAAVSVCAYPHISLTGLDLLRFFLSFAFDWQYGPSGINSSHVLNLDDLPHAVTDLKAFNDTLSVSFSGCVRYGAESVRYNCGNGYLVADKFEEFDTYSFEAIAEKEEDRLHLRRIAEDLVKRGAV